MGQALIEALGIQADKIPAFVELIFQWGPLVVGHQRKPKLQLKAGR